MQGYPRRGLDEETSAGSDVDRESFTTGEEEEDEERAGWSDEDRQEEDDIMSGILEVENLPRNAVAHQQVFSPPLSPVDERSPLLISNALPRGSLAPPAEEQRSIKSNRGSLTRRRLSVASGEVEYSVGQSTTGQSLFNT